MGRVDKGEAWSVGVSPSGAWTAAIKDLGLVTSSDAGATWQADESLPLALMAHAATAKSFTLHNLVMVLHTGKALLGKEYEWLWIDLVGGTTAFLSFSGLVVWWRARRRKYRAAFARLAADPRQGPASDADGPVAAAS